MKDHDHWAYGMFVQSSSHKASLSEIKEEICTCNKICWSFTDSLQTMHCASCVMLPILHPKTRCSGKNLISLTIRRWIHGIYWRTSLPEYWIKGYCSLQLLLCRQALMQEMKDYLHISSQAWVWLEKETDSGIKVTSLRVTFII